MNIPSVEMRHISKYFSRVVANDDVSISLNKGEVLALLGENGAGKSTIMKILYGLHSPDEGEILINGEKTAIKSPHDAKTKGIAMVQQHFSLVPTHTATENIILGNAKGYIQIEKYNEKIKQLATDYGFDIPVDKPIGQLAVGIQQKIEILKALYLNAEVLILDEPTAVLTPQESEKLINFIRTFVAKGNSIVFITHKLKEVMEVADRVIVMRNGRIAGTRNREELNEHDLARLMIGEDIIPPVRSKRNFSDDDKPLLEVENVSLKDNNGAILLDNVSLRIREGEIFGIAGVSGNGQDELCEVLCGLRKPETGRIVFSGEEMSDKTILEHNNAGLGYVPLDRLRDAMVPEMTLSENILLKSSFSDKWNKHGFIDKKKLDEYTANVIEKHRIKATGSYDRGDSLSGGNQQKLILGREVDLGQRILIFNQPARGLDMGAVDRIHHVIMEEKNKGKAILLVSTEISELFEMCDKIAVMYKSRIICEFANGELTANQLGLLMAGISSDDGEKHEKQK